MNLLKCKSENILMRKKILITGISGFLGSQIAKDLILEGNEIIATKRTSSILWRCQEYFNNITWIDINEDNWQSKILEFHPEIIIHTAWSGVSANDRDDWDVQLSNIEFTLKLLQIAKECKIKKFIGFGSQAEYGNFSGIIDENYPLNPNSAYGSSKIVISQIINNFCTINEINWYWFRLFSFFGELENNNWFIPTLIDKISSVQKMDMTPGEQKYAYMYVGDLARIIFKIVKSNITSGIYNISSSKAISLLELTNKIIEIINPTESKINFGAIPYRDNQSMHIQGLNLKLEKELGGKIDELDFNVALNMVVKYKLNEI
jgi:nucleoside-diphosphate-sugar epimerase